VAKKQWCIPKVSAATKAALEDVLSVYARPFDPKRLVICLDEKVKFLLSSPTPNLVIRRGNCEKTEKMSL
jgi:hypothetical protein